MKGLVRVFAVIALMALMVMPFLGGQAAASKLAMPAKATQTVELQDYKFVPATLTVNVGDTITFANKGAVAHTATAGDGSWDSGNMDANATFNHTFSTAGTFVVYCRYHGSADGKGMAMTVTVGAAAPAPTATSAPAPAATPTASAAVTPTAATGTFPTGEADKVDVDDQPVGPSITLKEVHANVDGWIAVHSNTADNKPGPVLGHTAVKVGDNYNVVVQLSPAPVAGDKVWPMLHIDAGVIGTYEFPGPDAPVIINGNIVMKQITLTGAAAAAPTAAAGGFPTGEADKVDVDDQPAGSSITLKEVHANVAGFIAVHANTADNKPGPVLGHTAVAVGDNYNVVVQLSPAPVAGDKVWPMLHIDAGVIGTYEFPGPDAPVIINGNIVMKQITLTAASNGSAPAMPVTGNGSLVDLWPIAFLGVLLILAGSLTLRRRTA